MRRGRGASWNALAAVHRARRARRRGIASRHRWEKHREREAKKKFKSKSSKSGDEEEGTEDLTPEEYEEKVLERAEMIRSMKGFIARPVVGGVFARMLL